MESGPSALRSRTTQPCTTLGHEAGTLLAPQRLGEVLAVAPGVPERAASASRTTRSRGPKPGLALVDLERSEDPHTHVSTVGAQSVVVNSPVWPPIPT